MRKALLLLVSFSLVLPSLLAQTDPVLEEKWKNGFLPSGTYGGNGVAVNLYNGGFMISIPIVSLPGRAGHDLNITATYNSKQLVRRDIDPDPDFDLYQGEYFNTGPTMGRWVVNVWPALEVISTIQYNHVYRFTTPDGAVHRLDRCVFYGPGQEFYYAADGTNIRYSVANQQVQLINGEVFDFSQYVSPDYKIFHRDRNGNQITYHFALGGGWVRPVKITDTLGREVFLRYDNSPDPRTITSIAVKNHAGVEKSWTFGYTNTYVVEPTLSYYNCRYWQGTLTPWVLQTLTLPNNTAYHFTYNIEQVFSGYYRYDGSCWGCPIFVDRSTLQMTSMTAPTGAMTSFGYYYWEPGGDENYNNRLNRLIGSITVDPVGGGSFTTTYAYTYFPNGQVSRTTETRADGSKRIVDWIPPASADEYLRQAEYLVDTNGAYLQKISTQWSTTTSGKLAGLVTTEYYQDGQYNQNGTVVANAQVENLYDSYGNPTETRSYETQMLARTTRQFDISESSSTWYFSKLVKEEDRRFHYNCSQAYAWDEVVTASTSFLYDEL